MLIQYEVVFGETQMESYEQSEIKDLEWEKRSEAMSKKCKAV